MYIFSIEESQYFLRGDDCNVEKIAVLLGEEKIYLCSYAQEDILYPRIIGILAK